MTREMQTKLQEMLANIEFHTGLCNCMKMETALAYFKDHGLVLEDEEALKTWNAAMEEYNLRYGAITDEELDSVAAGSCFRYCTFERPMGNCLEWLCLGQ